MDFQYLQAVQQHAIHNFYAKQDVQFVNDGRTFTVNTKVSETSLHRLNAMTLYEHKTPFIIIAKTFQEIPIDLFYLILTVENGWVEVDIETGEKITCEIENSDM